MKNIHSVRGFITLLAAGKIVAAVVIVILGLFVTKEIVGHRGGKSPSGSETALAANKTDEAKIGQQYAAVTTQALAQTKASDDPALALAKLTAPKADGALANGLGGLTPEQNKLVQDQIANALSPVVAKQQAAEAARNALDAQLVEKGRENEALSRKIAAEQGHSGFIEKILLAVAVYFAVTRLLLPWLEGKFPGLSLAIGMIQKIVDPWIADVKAVAQQKIAVLEADGQKLITSVGGALSQIRTNLGNAKQVVAIFDANTDAAHQAAIGGAVVAATTQAATATAQAAIATAQAAAVANVSAPLNINAA